ncbi:MULTISPECIES: hypothetical protein [Bacteria]|uniref:hypothetical protein n=1 Tax=Bacteria TaxID=2 RepID=UPI002FC904EC
MNKFNKIASITRRASLLAVCAAALAACGGGGGGGGGNGDTPNLVNPSAILQNFWSGTVTNGADGATRASAVVMPDGTAWVAMESAAAVVGVAKVALSGTAIDADSASLTGTGNYYPLTPVNSPAQALTAAGTVTAASLTGTATTAAGTSTLNWIPVTSPAFASAAQAADVQATWKAQFGGAVGEVTWIIDGAGALTAGSQSNLGCTYTGSVKPSAGSIAVFDVTAAEVCAGVTRNLAGIATLNGAKTSLRVMYTADSDARANIAAFNK